MSFSIPPPQHNRLTLKCFALMILFGAGIAHAQVSVAPSQTGQFFNDLRQRAYQFRNGTQPQQQSQQQPTSAGSDGVYDYTRGEYLGEQTNSENTSGSPENDAYRSLGEQGYRSGYVGYARRNSGDYTSNAGPYPTAGTYFAPAYISDPFMQGKRNLQIGPVGIGFGLNTNVEYNDNITRSNTNKISDIIGGANLSVNMLYPITQNNQLTLNTVIGIDRYFEHPELSLNGKSFILNVAPGSSLAFDMRIGEVTFTFYERVSVRPQTQDSFAVDNLNLFGVFQNDAGIGANWAINSKLNLSINYNNSIGRALEHTYDVYNRNVDSLSGSLAWTPTGTWTLGAEASYSKIKYQQSYNNSGTTLNGGLFLVVPITKNTVLKVAGGYQDFKFNTPAVINTSVAVQAVSTIENQITALQKQIVTTETITDPAQRQIAQSALLNQNTTLTNQLAQANAALAQQNARIAATNGDTNGHLSDPYYNFTLTNQLNARINQYLTFGHESSLNTNTNFITADYVTYGVGFILWRGARLNLSGYYEKANESGGRLKEDTKQGGVDVYLSHKLAENLTLGLGYHYGQTNADVINRSYRQNALSADLNYIINRKLSMGLGYRFLVTDASEPSLGFDQNRIIITANYNF